MNELKSHSNESDLKDMKDTKDSKELKNIIYTNKMHILFGGSIIGMQKLSM